MGGLWGQFLGDSLGTAKYPSSSKTPQGSQGLLWPWSAGIRLSSSSLGVPWILPGRNSARPGGWGRIVPKLPQEQRGEGTQCHQVTHPGGLHVHSRDVLHSRMPRILLDGPNPPAPRNFQPWSETLASLKCGSAGFPNPWICLHIPVPRGCSQQQTVPRTPGSSSFPAFGKQSWVLLQPGPGLIPSLAAREGDGVNVIFFSQVCFSSRCCKAVRIPVTFPSSSQRFAPPSPQKVTVSLLRHAFLSNKVLCLHFCILGAV